MLVEDIDLDDGDLLDVLALRAGEAGTQSRRLPAFRAAVEALPEVAPSEEEASSGCAVCKDGIAAGQLVVPLPSKHFFHGDCIRHGWPSGTHALYADEWVENHKVLLFWQVKPVVHVFQVFNEVSSRETEKLNVFEGILDNNVFVAVLSSTVIFQFIIIQFLGNFANTTPLSFMQWIYCIFIGFTGMPIAAVVKMIPVGSW